MGSVFVRAFDGTECIHGACFEHEQTAMQKKHLNVFVATVEQALDDIKSGIKET